MQPVKIQIKIQPGQPLKVEVLNGQGSNCQMLTQSLAKLGQTETTPKPEYYEEPNLQTQTNLQLGGQW
jgi:hypothetical protein